MWKLVVTNIIFQHKAVNRVNSEWIVSLNVNSLHLNPINPLAVVSFRTFYTIESTMTKRANCVFFLVGQFFVVLRKGLHSLKINFPGSVNWAPFWKYNKEIDFSDYITETRAFRNFLNNLFIYRQSNYLYFFGFDDN